MVLFFFFFPPTPANPRLKNPLGRDIISAIRDDAAETPSGKFPGRRVGVGICSCSWLWFRWKPETLFIWLPQIRNIPPKLEIFKIPLCGKSPTVIPGLTWAWILLIFLANLGGILCFSCDIKTSLPQGQGNQCPSFPSPCGTLRVLCAPKIWERIGKEISAHAGLKLSWTHPPLFLPRLGYFIFSGGGNSAFGICFQHRNIQTRSWILCWNPTFHSLP